MAFDHVEPDRVPVFEIHINTRPASEILGRPVQGMGGADIGIKRNKMIAEGRADEFYRRDMETRMELCQTLELDIIRAFPYPVDPLVPRQTGENLWRIEDKHGYWWCFRYAADGDLYMESDSCIKQGGVDRFEQLVNDMEKHGTTLLGCAIDGLPIVSQSGGGGPSLEGTSFSSLEWAGKTDPDLCVMGWADIGFYHNSWMEVLLEAMASRPELVDRWMAMNLQQVLLQLETQLKLGADLILGGQDICYRNGPMFSPRHYERFIKPGLLAITEMCHEYDIPYLRHNDGNITAIEESFLLESGIDGWHAIEPCAGMDIFYFKDKYGDRITLAGNIDCGGSLESGTPEEIRNEVREKIKHCAPGGGYIIASSNSIHSAISGRNYQIMLEAIAEFGSYPINLA
jgi:hypothetical protein